MSVLIQSLSRTPSIFPLQTFILFMVSNVYVGSSLFAFLRNLGSFLSFLVWCFVMCKILLRSHACRSNHMCSFVKEPPSNTSLQLYVYKCLERVSFNHVVSTKYVHLFESAWNSYSSDFICSFV